MENKTTKQQNNQKEFIYIDFETLENYYKIYLLEMLESKEIKINKNNDFKKVLNQFNNYNIYYITPFKELYYNLYNNNDFILLIIDDTFTIINLNNNEINKSIISWWVNDENDFINYLKSLLNENNISYDENTINNILTNYKNINC